MEHLPYFYLMVSQPGDCSTESQLLLCGFVPALCVGGCAIAHMVWSCVCASSCSGGDECRQGSCAWRFGFTSHLCH